MNVRKNIAFVRKIFAGRRVFPSCEGGVRVICRKVQTKGGAVYEGVEISREERFPGFYSIAGPGTDMLVNGDWITEIIPDREKQREQEQARRDTEAALFNKFCGI